MIVLFGMPIPPSVNELFENRIVPAGKAKRMQGRFSSSISRRKSPAYEHYELMVKMWANRNHKQVRAAIDFISASMGAGLYPRFDIFIAQPKSDFIAKNGNLKGIDSNNYVKAQIDVLVKILGVDDKWFPGGSYEKVSCDGKESQCTVIISAQRIRSLSEILKIYSEEPGSQNSEKAIPLKSATS